MTARAAMADELALSPTSPTKTFVVEAHVEDPLECLRGLTGSGRVEESTDAFLFKVHTDFGYFWVDQLNPRFWSLHTDMPTKNAGSLVNGWVANRRDLDWMWLPSEHLRHMWPNAQTRRVRTNFKGTALLGSAGAETEELGFQLSGRNAEAFLDFLSRSDYRDAVPFDRIESHIDDPDFGGVREAVSRMGKFVASGDSFPLHLAFVSRAVSRYSKLVTLCESKAISWSALGTEDGGGNVTGGPIAIRFSKQIHDQDAFLSELFSSRAPFRLWGRPAVTADGIAEVAAVDLHVGQQLRIDVGNDWMRIYLGKDGCGNTVARLVSNLQHHFDAALQMVDPELQAAISPRPLASTA